MTPLLQEFPYYLLVLARVGCLLFFFPPWDSRLVPVPIKLGAALAMLLLGEFLLGLSLGLVARLIFAGVRMAGNMAGIQMGFGMVTLIDPGTAEPSSVMEDILFLAATLIFLAADGHHLLIRILAESFSQVSVGGIARLPGPVFHLILPLAGLMFSLALKLTAPVLGALFVANLALGLVGRAIPQMQIMIVSFPLTIALGLFFLALTLSLAGPYLAGQFLWLQHPLRQVLRAWQG